MIDALAELVGAGVAGTVLELLLRSWLLAAVLLLAALAAASRCRDAPAAVRHALWSAALIGALALPLAAGTLPRWEAPVLPPAWTDSPRSSPSESSTVPPAFSHKTEIPASTFDTGVPAPTHEADGGRTAAGEAPIGPVDASAGRVSGSSAPTVTEPTGTEPTRAEPSRAEATGFASRPLDSAWIAQALPTVMLAIWLLGSLIVISGYLRGRVRVRRLARRARATGTIPCGRRTVRLIESDEISMPLTWGTLRPVIAMPTAARAWSAERKRLVMLHELTHVRRLDSLTHALARLACALHWLNPLVWVAARRQRAEQENACDELVLESGVRPSTYAGHLLAVARGLTGDAREATAAALPAVRRHGLDRRVASILDGTPGAGGVRRVLSLALVVTFAVALLPLASAQPVPRAPEAPAAQDGPDPATEPSEVSAATGSRAPVPPLPSGMPSALSPSSSTATLAPSPVPSALAPLPAPSALSPLPRPSTSPLPVTSPASSSSTVPGTAPGSPTAAAQSSFRGDWTARLDDDRFGDDGIHLRLEYEHDGDENSWGTSFDADELEGLDPQRLNDRGAPLAFRIRRGAGTLEFEGRGGTRRATGEFTFTPSASYRRAMGELGYGDLTVHDQFTFTMLDLDLEQVRGYHAAGYDDLTTDELRRFAIHGVGVEFLQAMADHGYRPSAEGAVKMRIHGVSPEFVGGLQEMGYGHVPVEDVIKLRIHGTSLDFIREMDAAGVDVGRVEEIVKLRIHGVSPDFVAEIRSLGFDADARELVKLRIHGVEPAMVEEFRAIGMDMADLDRLVKLRIHGVRPAWIQELRDAGLEGLTIDDAVKLRIHGVDADHLRAFEEMGLDDLGVDELAKMRIHDVTPEFVRDLVDAGYDDLTVEELVKIKIHGMDRIMTRPEQQ